MHLHSVGHQGHFISWHPIYKPKLVSSLFLLSLLLVHLDYCAHRPFISTDPPASHSSFRRRTVPDPRNLELPVGSISNKPFHHHYVPLLLPYIYSPCPLLSRPVGHLELLDPTNHRGTSPLPINIIVTIVDITAISYQQLPTLSRPSDEDQHIEPST